jgi:hypothetical protein
MWARRRTTTGGEILLLELEVLRLQETDGGPPTGTPRRCTSSSCSPAGPLCLWPSNQDVNQLGKTLVTFPWRGPNSNYPPRLRNDQTNRKSNRLKEVGTSWSKATMNREFKEELEKRRKSYGQQRCQREGNRWPDGHHGHTSKEITVIYGCRHRQHWPKACGAFANAPSNPHVRVVIHVPIWYGEVQRSYIVQPLYIPESSEMVNLEGAGWIGFYRF